MLFSSQQSALQWPNPWFYFFMTCMEACCIQGMNNYPSILRFITNHYRRIPYQPISIMECNMGCYSTWWFERCLLLPLIQFDKAPMELLCSSDEDFEVASTITTEQHGPQLEAKGLCCFPQTHCRVQHRVPTGQSPMCMASTLAKLGANSVFFNIFKWQQEIELAMILRWSFPIPLVLVFFFRLVRRQGADDPESQHTPAPRTGRTRSTSQVHSSTWRRPTKG